MTAPLSPFERFDRHHASSSSAYRPNTPTKTVAVMGASYGGARAAKLLSQSLPPDWRLVVIDRNSHMNHVYVFPRFTILPAHAPKAYVPYVNHLSTETPTTPTMTSSEKSKLVSSPLKNPLTPPLTPTSSNNSNESLHDHDDHRDHDRHSTTSTPGSPGSDDTSYNIGPHTWIQGIITKITPHSVHFTRPPSPLKSRKHSLSISTSTSSFSSVFDMNEYFQNGLEEVVHFDFAIYALGAGLPDPCNVWKPVYGADTPGDGLLSVGSKKCGVRFMQRMADQLKLADRILIVGAGALGIQYATDLKEIYPEKEVTLLHSRQRLMPIYPIAMHTAIMESLDKLGVNVVLGERVVTWPDNPGNLDGEPKIITTDKGRTFTSDLVLACTGQKPHVSLIAEMEPQSISITTNRIRVHPTMQISNEPIRPIGSRANTLEKLKNLSLGAATTLPTPPASADSEDNHSVKSINGSEDIKQNGSEKTLSTIATNGSIPQTEEVNGRAEDEKEGKEDLRHFYVVGDCAETGAIQAGHTAYWQAEVAARNILKCVNSMDIEDSKDWRDLELEEYKVTVPAIKVTLGMKTAVIANAEGVKVTHEGVEDLHAMIMWPGFQAEHLDVNS